MNPSRPPGGRQPQQAPAFRTDRSPADPGDPASNDPAAGSDQAGPVAGGTEEDWPDETEGGEDDEYVPL